MKILGIDPGTSTGVAVFEDGELTRLLTMSPVDMARFIAEAAPSRVVFEDSRLQSHVWAGAMSKAALAKIARNVGEIDAWCKLICAICEREQIAAHGVSPKNKGAKLNHDKFVVLTNWKSGSNQHERDAAMIAYPYRRAA